MAGNEPMRFRKKPVEVEAMYFNNSAAGRRIATWCNGVAVKASTGNTVIEIRIETLEGTMRADLGDWIIKGVKGEFYPCKPDIFEATYEAAI